MKIIRLEQLIREVVEETLQNKSKAGEEAKRQGLTNLKFGRWGKEIDGKMTTTHVSQNGKLVAVKKSAPTAKGKVSTGANPTRQATKTVAAKKIDSVANKLYRQYDRDGDHDDRYSGVHAATTVITHKNPSNAEELYKLIDAMVTATEKRDDKDGTITPDEWFQGVYDFRDKYQKTLNDPTSTRIKDGTN